MSNQTPYAWAVTGVQNMYLGELAEHDAKLEAACCGGTARAFPLYASPITPAKQVPTDKQIDAALAAWFGVEASMSERMRAAIKAAHGSTS